MNYFTRAGPFVSKDLLSGQVTRLYRLLLLLRPLLLFGVVQPCDAQWYLEAGLIYRGGMEISVQGGSSVVNSGASAAQAGTTGGLPVAQFTLLNDDGTASILRMFDNGYVGPSGFNWARGEGITQYYGYQNAGQYSAATSTVNYRLTLQATSAPARRTVTQVEAQPLGRQQGQRVFGRGLMGTVGYGFNRDKPSDWKWSAQLRLSWLRDIRGDFGDHSTYSQTIDRSIYEATWQQSEVYAYAYNTLGNPFFPAAPYSVMNPMGVGPLIADTPDAITRISGSSNFADNLLGHSTEIATSRSQLEVDAHAFTVQLGPRLRWHSESNRVSLFLQPALTLNRLHATIQRQEIFRQADGSTIATWEDSRSDRSWLSGASVQIGAQVALRRKWYLALALDYDWVHQSEVSLGPDRISVDLSGYQFEIGIGRSF